MNSPWQGAVPELLIAGGLVLAVAVAGYVMAGWAGLAVPHFLPQILPAVEVGWRLLEAYRGQGLATEVGAAAVDWGFTEGGLDRIVSIYEPENAASGRVMERLGFTYELTTSGPRGRTVDVTQLTRPQWEARNRHG